ncbi:MAG: nicotinate-nucleotide--dimethylbenzimidazole phosphoribosyltransferase [Candidatus Nitrohelix vancouverensis]|uniref:Nicotinate-nucleotide--dimethylbenzimidazole phosphoribosyltransferase n=1 Tax=Candidatus Nitrohelix vancouverensis TaxID=2705534 RepID=A0A7T0G3N9_9BACT|nr:MAG: nicotinate-nucleotide--dimethylbenzimidazole phosphoribosyltransferase [Candidatus Nitrohelix vancouverensis]
MTLHPSPAIESAIRSIGPLSEGDLAQAQRRLDSLTKPPGSLGRLEELAKLYIAIRQPNPTPISQKSIYIFAADHGVVQEGVSAYPSDVTRQMVLNFLNQGAAINVLARHIGADVVVVDVGVDYDFGSVPGLIGKKIARGTRNMAKETAMTSLQAIQSIEIGIELATRACSNGNQILAAGEMGIGNTTAATAVMCAVGKKSPRELAGRGAGVDDAGLLRKIQVLETALQKHAPSSTDPMRILESVGGFEIGAMTGFYLGAAAQRTPCIVDGLISAAGAVIAILLEPKVKEYLIASHRSQEPAHEVFFQLSGLEPLLDLGMRLGEGSGAALAMNLLHASVNVYFEMATFEEAQISDKMNANAT